MHRCAFFIFSSTPTPEVLLSCCHILVTVKDPSDHYFNSFANEFYTERQHHLVETCYLFYHYFPTSTQDLSPRLKQNDVEPVLKLNFGSSSSKNHCLVRFHDLDNDGFENETGGWIGVDKNIVSAIC
jgi:hypothetical protein